MRLKCFAFFVLFVSVLAASAQGNTNPQTSFSAQILSESPSVYLTFNNPSVPLRENQTGVQFT